MKQLLHLVVLGLTLSTVSVFAAKPGSESPASAEYKYIGISDNPSIGIGLTGVTNICRDTYGADARMATSEEVMAELIISDAIEEVWVQPVIEFAFSGGSSGIQYIDISGALAGDCTSGGQGLTFVTNPGVFQPRSCNETLRVACSTPQ